MLFGESQKTVVFLRLNIDILIKRAFYETKFCACIVLIILRVAGNLGFEALLADNRPCYVIRHLRLQPQYVSFKCRFSASGDMLVRTEPTMWNFTAASEKIDDVAVTHEKRQGHTSRLSR